jgi:transcriptional regulator with XRE-family HTH domain
LNGPGLRRLRLRLGLTQSQMATRLRLHLNTYSLYERNKRRIPGPVEIAALCIANHGQR